jgi:cytochrome c2
VLYTFQGGKSGVGPALGVVSDQQGNLYGTTYSGGLSKTCCGIVYKLTR